MTQRKVRVRFAPGPGANHIGGVHAAFYTIIYLPNRMVEIP